MCRGGGRKPDGLLWRGRNLVCLQTVADCFDPVARRAALGLTVHPDRVFGHDAPRHARLPLESDGYGVRLPLESGGYGGRPRLESGGRGVCLDDRLGSRSGGGSVPEVADPHADHQGSHYQERGDLLLQSRLREGSILKGSCGLSGFCRIFRRLSGCYVSGDVKFSLVRLLLCVSQTTGDHNAHT